MSFLLCYHSTIFFRNYLSLPRFGQLVNGDLASSSERPASSGAVRSADVPLPPDESMSSDIELVGGLSAGQNSPNRQSISYSVLYSDMNENLSI